MKKPKSIAHKTRFAILLSSLLHEPFTSLFPLLPFILIKDLGATTFQIVLLTMLKPLVSIFSFYWSEKISQKKHSLKLSLIASGLLARIPFLLVLFIDNVWLLIFASTLYMLYSRGGIPAWMEILKVNLPDRLREKYFSIGSMIGYAEGVLIAIGIGSLLDKSVDSWKFFYLASLLIGVIGVFVQGSIPIREERLLHHEKAPSNKTFWMTFVQPWIDSFSLMKTRPDFQRFQWGFMLCGLGLMIIQPAIPLFFADVLKLSYKDLLIAYTICKGLGFVLATPLWNQAMSRISVGIFSAFVHIGFALFPFLIIASLQGHFWLYLAYFVYGIAQAGSHLIWHLSGPFFAEQEKSARFTGVNIMMVGVRGTVGPPLGGILVSLFSPAFVLVVSIFLSLSAIIPMVVKAPRRLRMPSS